MSDILEELDAWLRDNHHRVGDTASVIQRARDEIAALRKIALWDKQVRNEALEEAASAAGAAIRGLKR